MGYDTLQAEKAKAKSDIIDALSKRPLSEPRFHQTFLCRWCLNIVSQVPKTQNEYVPLRAILLIPDSCYDPPICDRCYDNVTGSFNRHATNIGTSNHGPDNILLRRLVEGRLKVPEEKSRE